MIVTSDFSPEVKIRPFRAFSMNMQYSQGGAIILTVGVQILLPAKRAEKFWDVPPHMTLQLQHMTFWGYNQ